MRISDWSSDVCSSDLRDPGQRVADQEVAAADGDHRDIALRGFHPVDAVRQHRLHPLPYGALDLGAERRDARRVAESRPAGGTRGIAGGQRPSPDQAGLASDMKADRVRAETPLTILHTSRFIVPKNAQIGNGG